MNSEAVASQDIFTRMGIEPTPKAKGIREVMAENAQRVLDAQALHARVNLTAIKTSARAL